jgi:hypothetical protein
MRRDRKFLTIYFVVFGALSLLAVIPGVPLMVLLLTSMALPLFGAPGFLVIASPTILLYSSALVPLWRALAVPGRGIWPIAIALAAGFPIAVAIAIGPGMLSQNAARLFGLQISKDDFSRSPVAAKPKSIELIGDLNSGLFAHGQAVGDSYAPCNEVCRRLLFNGEADWVRMTRIPDIYMKKRSGTTRSVTYHLEHRDSCPELFPIGTTIEKAVRDRLIAGDCVIAEPGGDTAPDSTVKFTTRYSHQHYPKAPPDKGPNYAIIETVKDFRIESREGGALTPVVQQTETVARTLALPFYIGHELSMQGGPNGPTLGRDKLVMNAVDLAQELRDALGYELAEISPPPSEDTKQIAERILALPPDAHPGLSAQQQDAIGDVLAAMAKQRALSDADVDFLRRVIADKRVTEGKVGISIQDMFRKSTARLEPLIPVILDRLGTPGSERVGHYNSMLGWSLTSFSAESLQPYRDRLVAVVEAEPNWPSNGPLTRLAELGGDEAINLVIRRLDSKSGRQFAAVAACRASAEAWPALEPAVLARLTLPRQGNRLQDDENPLLLALVRFGKKELVADMIAKRGLFDEKRTFERLAKFEPGFDPKRCRDRL